MVNGWLLWPCGCITGQKLPVFQSMAKNPQGPCQPFCNVSNGSSVLHCLLGWVEMETLRGLSVFTPILTSPLWDTIYPLIPYSFFTLDLSLLGGGSIFLSCSCLLVDRPLYVWIELEHFAVFRILAYWDLKPGSALCIVFSVRRFLIALLPKFLQVYRIALEFNTEVLLL
jgi:hypothetical protein